MKALEHLLVNELTELRALESKLYSAYDGLKDAPEEQVERFVSGLADLKHRALRVDEMLNAMSMPEAA